MNEFAPHLAALARCVDAGFQFRPIPDGLHGFRVRAEALDLLVVRDASEAFAARYRMADLDDDRHQAIALWLDTGTVADVVAALLALPRGR